MFTLLGLLLSTANASSAAVEAMEAELERATTALHLPDEELPWYVAYDLVDGEVYTAHAEFGALLQDDELPLRLLRVEVRTGDARMDSANFDAFGEPDGVLITSLPIEDDVLAMRRSIWLATDRAYKQSVEQLSRKQAELPPPEETDPPAIWPADPVVSLEAEAPELQPELIRAAVKRLSGVLADYPELESGQAVGRDWQGVRTTVSSEGMRLARPTGYAVVRVEAVMKGPDGERLRDGRWWVVDRAEDLPPIEEMEREIREMASWLVALKDAPLIDDYLGPVLFEGPAAVELFRQLVAPEMVGTPPPAEGRGFFGEVTDKRPTARIGRRLLPEGWTVVDDPSQDATGSYRWDHDGVPGERVVIVEDGVVRDVLLSRIPKDPDGRSNGHGRGLGTSRREAVPSIVSVTPQRARRQAVLERKALRLAGQTGHDEVLVIRLLEPPAMTEDFHIYFTGEGPAPGLTRPYEAYLLDAQGNETPVRGLAFVGVDRRALRDIVVAGAPTEYVGVLDAQPGPERFNLGAVSGLPGAWSAPPVLISELELVGQSGGDERSIPAPPRPASTTETGSLP